MLLLIHQVIKRQKTDITAQLLWRVRRVMEILRCALIYAFILHECVKECKDLMNK